MNVLVLLITSFLVLIFLIIHSYLLRDIRLTINFFTFAFIWAFMKEFAGIVSLNLKLPHRPPYEFIDKKIPIIFHALIPTIGWVFVFYLSWALAERVLKRVKYFQHSLFATLLVSGFIIASVSYCVEAAAIGVSWWQWIKRGQYMSNFVVGVPFIALEAWCFFGIHFLLAFFLMECSKFKRTDWKGIFFIIPFIHHWIFRFFEPLFWRMFEERFVLSLIFILSLIWPLQFEYVHPEDRPLKQKKFNQNTFQFWENIPIFVSLFMLLIVVIIDIGLLHRPELLISCLPIIFFILLAINRIKFLFLVVLAFTLILTFEKKIIFTTFPVMSILILQIFSWIKRKEGIMKKIVYIILTCFLVVLVISGVAFLRNQVTISGRVIFEGYKEGSIWVVVRSKDPLIYPRSPLDVVVRSSFPYPGEFKLKVPKKFKKLYIEALNLKPDEDRPTRDTPRGIYKGNPVNLTSPYIRNIDIVIRPSGERQLFSPQLKGETVTISGNIIFDTYTDGPIRIGVSRNPEGPADINWTEIDRPGRYSIEVPKNISYVYIKAINIKIRKRREQPAGYRGAYDDNPLKVGSADIDNIDIIIESRLD